jgi:hypothetical protein
MSTIQRHAAAPVQSVRCACGCRTIVPRIVAGKPLCVRCYCALRAATREEKPDAR